MEEMHKWMKERVEEEEKKERREGRGRMASQKIELRFKSSNVVSFQQEVMPNSISQLKDLTS